MYYIKYKLFVGESQPSFNAMHSHRTKHSSTGVGACVMILVDLFSNIQTHTDCKRKILFETVLYFFNYIFFIVKTYIVKTILCTLQGSYVEMTSLKALSLVECRMNMVGLPHNDCYRTSTTPPLPQSGANSSLTLKMNHHSVKARPTASKNNMTV